MLLEFYGIEKSEKELRILFKSTPLHGTYWKFVKDGVERFDVNFNYAKGQTMEMIEELLKNQVPSIASINAKMIGAARNVNHTVLVVGIDEEGVIFHDPEVGENIRLNSSDFSEAWGARKKRLGYILKP